MNILDKFLAKRGVASPEELDNLPLPDETPSERQVFNQWRQILSKENVTVEDIRKFCQEQINIIETKWSDYTIEANKKAEFIPYHTVYRTILSVIDSPQSARETLEMQLNQLLNS